MFLSCKWKVGKLEKNFKPKYFAWGIYSTEGFLFPSIHHSAKTNFLRWKSFWCKNEFDLNFPRFLVVYVGYYPNGKTVDVISGISQFSQCSDLCTKRRASYRHCYGATFDFNTGNCRLHTSKSMFRKNHNFTISTT